MNKWIVAALLLSLSVVATPSRAEEKETELSKTMEQIDKAYKKLKNQVADAGKNADSLALLADMEKNSVAAKAMVPERAESEKDKAAFSAAYRAGMCDFIAELLNCEKALLANKNDEAAASVKKMAELKNAGHKKFQKDE